MKLSGRLVAPTATAAVALFSSCGTEGDSATTTHAGQAETAERIAVLCDRSEDDLALLLDRFQRSTGIEVDVEYGAADELAARLLSDGGAQDVDVYVARDAGALGRLAEAALLAELPPSVLHRVGAAYHGTDWVGVSGSARVVVHRADDDAELPTTLSAFTEPGWRRRIAWAPRAHSFQVHVTAMRAVLGEQETETWLRGLLANDVIEKEDESAVAAAVAAGEADVGFACHVACAGLDGIALHPLEPGDIGSLVHVSGAAMLAGAAGDGPRRQAALALIEFLLLEEAQAILVERTGELALANDAAKVGVVSVEIGGPEVDLAALGDLAGTVRLLRKVEAIP